MNSTCFNDFSSNECPAARQPMVAPHFKRSRSFDEIDVQQLEGLRPTSDGAPIHIPPFGCYDYYEPALYKPPVDDGRRYLHDEWHGLTPSASPQASRYGNSISPQNTYHAQNYNDGYEVVQDDDDTATNEPSESHAAVSEVIKSFITNRPISNDARVLQRLLASSANSQYNATPEPILMLTWNGPYREVLGHKRVRETDPSFAAQGQIDQAMCDDAFSYGWEDGIVPNELQTKRYRPE